MLRFRNRFKGSPSRLHTCPCGLRVTESREAGRQILIHELPWCFWFEGIMKKLSAEPGTQLHHAVVLGEIGKSVAETIVVTDGDTTEDVEHLPDLRSRGPVS